MNIHVIDIDGTISDDTWRRRYLLSEPPDYDGYNCGCDLDDPMNCSLVEDVPASDTLLFLTARPRRYRQPTERWLHKTFRRASRPNTVIMMRPDGNMDTSPRLKCDLLRPVLEGNNIQLVADDREDVLRAMRADFGAKLGKLLLVRGNNLRFEL